MTTKYCMCRIISDNQKGVKRDSSLIRKILCGGPRTRPVYRPDLALRARDAALDRIRAICPRGNVTQISPIQSGLTPLIGLALKLERLTRPWPLPRSIVFR